MTSDVKTVGGTDKYQATPNPASYGLVNEGGDQTIGQSPNQRSGGDIGT